MTKPRWGIMTYSQKYLNALATTSFQYLAMITMKIKSDVPMDELSSSCGEGALSLILICGGRVINVPLRRSRTVLFVVLAVNVRERERERERGCDIVLRIISLL